MARRPVLIVIVLALGLLAAGCGGGGSSSSDDTTATTVWANGLCSALTTWKGSLESAATQLTSGNISKETINGAVDDIRTSTDSFVDDLKGLGKPDTAAGQKAKASLDKLADELQSDVSDVQDAVGGASSLTELLAALPTLRTALTSMATQFQTTRSELNQLDAKGELKDAFEQADSCDSLTKSS